MKLSTGILYLIIAWTCFWLPGYLHGKSVADRWYAAHPCWPMNTILADENGYEDVTVIGHDITVINGNHLVVVQCNKETNGASFRLPSGETLVCSDYPDWKWR